MMKSKILLSAATLVLPFATAFGAAARFSLGLPSAPEIRDTATVSQNAWLQANTAYTAMCLVAPIGGTTDQAVSAQTVAGAPQVKLTAVESGFPLERTKPEYYLGDKIDPPGGVDWSATYAHFQSLSEDKRQGFLFDPIGEAVYVTAGGTLSFTWKLTGGSDLMMTYITASSCMGRPRRIYWTDQPYNGPGVDLSGKFVKFFGDDKILKPTFGESIISAGGVEQTITNRVISGLYLDKSSNILFAYGELQGQVVMAYYDTGTYEHLLHVQTIEVCRPDVNVLPGEIGRALKPDGRGYDTSGLRARPTKVNPTDNRGEYLYQHQGHYSYSPKNGEVYPLRPTMDCRQKAEIYWMETDEMEVQWPFEVDHYECDWPKDATLFVRGDVAGDYGRPIYVPTDYTPTLMSFQEPEGHALAPEADGTFKAVGEGYSLLRLTTDDDIWFLPIHSVLRTNTNYFTLASADIAVGTELRLREGALAGTAPGFSPACDPASPGSIYEANSARIWNPSLYLPAKPETQDAGTVDATAIAESGGDTNKYDSVIYAVTAKATDPKIEVWWNTTIQKEDMPTPITIPSLPQVYSVKWPESWEVPHIVIASQLGSAGESCFSHNRGLSLDAVASSAKLASRAYFSEDGGTVTFWVKPGANFAGTGQASLFSVQSNIDSTYSLTFDLRKLPTGTNIVVSVKGELPVNIPVPADALKNDFGGWFPVAASIRPDSASVFVGRNGAKTVIDNNMMPVLGGGTVDVVIGAVNNNARTGVALGEVSFWAVPLEFRSTDGGMDIATALLRPINSVPNGLTGLFSFRGDDVYSDEAKGYVCTERVLGIRFTAAKCSMIEQGPPLIDNVVIDADDGFTPRLYVQNDSEAEFYNPNEEHGLVRAGSGGYVAWALRADLNRADSSEPGVLVEYVKAGRKTMKWFTVDVTSDLYPELAADCVAGKALPGPHPLDLFDDPWCKDTYWDEKSASSPAHRDRKLQLWAKAAGNLHVHMFYPMQDGFAFPSIDPKKWPAVRTPVPWLALLDNPTVEPLSADPVAWLWRVSWPKEVPEMEIGRTLTIASAGLPEVWNAKSVGVVWPATDSDRNATAVLFDPTVAQESGFNRLIYATIPDVISAMGIKQGVGGNGTLRKGKWTFKDLPPSISSRFYLDTTASVTNCLKLVGEQEDNPGGVSLLHVNVLNDEEREALRKLMDATATSQGKQAWQVAIDNLARVRVEPSPHKDKNASETVIDYKPRDHYALFTMGATNYVTIIQNDSTNKLMNVAEGDPIQMHVIKVVPRYYVGRVVTREDPLNLLSQQLSVIYAETFAGSPEDYVFEWKRCSPHTDGTVPTDFEGEYSLKFPLTAGLTRFVIGGQGDTLANMVNTYYAMRYRAASTSSPAYKTMGYNWSEWTDPPALAEGWVQRVLNNVTPFTQRMRDLVENEAETAVTMIRQAGAPYEGDVALSQDNLTNIGLIQLYETLLSKAESMSLQLEINDADANKQLQLAVARLADLYNLLGDEAYTDALNPTIGFGSSYLDYGALSSALFCFDNQVPTLLDEELALLRGRTQDMAPSTHLSPYFNRLVWNFTRGMNAGEVAYAVNYDISGNNKGVIDYSQAAEMYPQGHGDAYGHYLSALSGYYRLMRNPFFSWGKPAMGEMVVADAVVNVDYYDEANFAKTAYNVAKTALDVVDRTARKSYRDNGGAPSAGYVDSNVSRNFGYGEWASRGGFGALCNWAVGNSLLEEEPRASGYSRFAFTGEFDRIYLQENWDVPDNYDESTLDVEGSWTVEFQVSAGEGAAPSGKADLVTITGQGAAMVVSLDGDNGLSILRAPVNMVQKQYTQYTLYFKDSSYTNDYNDLPWYGFEMRNGSVIASCSFWGADPPRTFPSGFDVADALGWPAGRNIPEWEGWTLFRNFSDDEIFENESVVDTANADVAQLGQIPSGESVLVAVRCSGGQPIVTVFDAAGAKVIDQQLSFDMGIRVDDVTIGGRFVGEIGEFRVWDGVRRSDDELLAKRSFVSPLADGLALSLRTISKEGATSVRADEKDLAVEWVFEGGEWRDPAMSGIAIDFKDDGLKRIDRSTVTELASLAEVASQIQKKVDQMDAGFNPLGLSAAAIPFDITPIGMEDGTATHFEQIRARAGTALTNARAALDKAQENSNRMRMIQDAAEDKENSLESEELAFKNRMIEYFGYPYAGDIGPSGTYPQGYDGPDIYHYAWMDPKDFGVDKVKNSVKASLEVKIKPLLGSVFVPFMPASWDDETRTLSFELSANGMIAKPDTVTGKRLAQGKIQDALAAFIVAYAGFNDAVDGYESRVDDFESKVIHSLMYTTIYEAKAALQSLSLITESIYTAKKVALETLVTTVEALNGETKEVFDGVKQSIPKIMGAGMTVNTDPSAIAAGAINGAETAARVTYLTSLTTTKNMLSINEATQFYFSIPEKAATILEELISSRLDEGYALLDAWNDLDGSLGEVYTAYRNLQIAQAAVETVVAEAQRVIDERTLARQQAVDSFTQMRYNEMFFRIQRDNSLARYNSMFDLAQKYVYLAAQAYDYETGLLSADSASGEKFISRIVGARTLGEFDGNGNPMVATGTVKGDGGLADILAEMDANWLVLKPRLGINNPQPYATWFSLRHDLFRIFDGEEGDAAWKTELRKYVVEDLNAVPEFTRYCQPLAGSTTQKEPGFVIPFSSAIAHGYNFFGKQLASGDSSLDPTYYATHIAAAGVHFENYDRKVFANTPTAYLVPVGEDRMRAVGDAGTVISWKVVDQTIPAPYTVGSTKLDDPDWTPLFNGNTGGNDLGARIRKHPSFRAYYGAKGEEPGSDSLDCTRLVGRSAWNTKWLLIIPAGSMNSDRDAALGAFIGGADQDRDGNLEYEGVSDIKIGLRTYSASGN